MQGRYTKFRDVANVTFQTIFLFWHFLITPIKVVMPLFRVILCEVK